MTELEFADLWYLQQEAIFNQFVALTTTIFAYIVAGHLVARSLSRNVAIGFTSLYCLFAIGPISGYITNLLQLIRIVKEYVAMYPEGWVVFSIGTQNATASAIIVAAPVFLGFIGSIYYVHFYVRSDRSNL